MMSNRCVVAEAGSRQHRNPMTSGYRLLLVAGALGSVHVCSPCCGATNVTGTALISKGPYLQAPSPGVVAILWESHTNCPARVYLHSAAGRRTMDRILPSPLNGVSLTSEGTNSVKTTNVFYLYEALIEQLKPGRSYSYEVEINGQRTRRATFSTLDANATKATFIAYGDSRSVPAIHSLLAQRFDYHKPDFILHAGDLVAKGTDYDLWSAEFFTPLRSVLQHVPIFPVIGNHEQDGTNYLSYFHLPGAELWYSFDAGPVHVLALDYRDESTTGAQYQFARSDLLRTRAPWKIVFLHYPVFNIGGHASGWGHTNYLALFHEARVDLVLAGHSHLYERFRPVAPRSGFGNSAITYITTGGGGASLHTSFDHPALATRHTTNHYVLFEARAQRLRAKVFRYDGKLFDSFELTKRKGRLDPEYLLQSYPEESLKLVSAVSPCITTHAAGVPSVTNAIDLRISARFVRSGPAALQLSLASESARHYVMDSPSIAITTPPRGSTNFVWTKLRSTGVTQVSKTKDQELSPPLIFELKVRSGDHETIAYTGQSRVSTVLSAATNQSLVSVSADVEHKDDDRAE
jgi:predicted phosphodiesterase